MKIHEAKASLRDELKRRRNAVNQEQLAVCSQQIFENLRDLPVYQEATSVFCFLSYLSEVDTNPILEDLLNRKIRIAVPKIMDKTTMIAVPFSGWDDLKPDRLGIPTPCANTPDDGPFDLVITPGLGFSKQGGRLGYGRGYYDRWLAAHEVKQRLGICLEIQLVDQLPVEDTDVPLQLLITESRVYAC